MTTNLSVTRGLAPRIEYGKPRTTDETCPHTLGTHSAEITSHSPTKAYLNTRTRARTYEHTNTHYTHFPSPFFPFTFCQDEDTRSDRTLEQPLHDNLVARRHRSLQSDPLSDNQHPRLMGRLEGRSGSSGRHCVSVPALRAVSTSPLSEVVKLPIVRRGWTGVAGHAVVARLGVEFPQP